MAPDATPEREPRQEPERAWERMRQASLLETIGRLAGGVAHDLNNLLTVIRGSVHLLLRQAPEDCPVRREAETVREAAERAAALVRRLLAFIARRPSQQELLDPDELLTDLALFLRRALGERIEIRVRPGAAGARLLVDRGELEQALLNLAVNARDWMPGGGTLTFETSRAGGERGPRVRIAVRDTGDGIAPEAMARLFEPFFTTKAPGQGTGLGLAIVHSAVTRHGGFIDVETAPGKGTTFVLDLPAHLAAENHPRSG